MPVELVSSPLNDVELGAAHAVASDDRYASNPPSPHCWRTSQSTAGAGGVRPAATMASNESDWRYTPSNDGSCAPKSPTSEACVVVGGVLSACRWPAAAVPASGSTSTRPVVARGRPSRDSRGSRGSGAVRMGGVLRVSDPLTDARALPFVRQRPGHLCAVTGARARVREAPGAAPQTSADT